MFLIFEKHGVGICRLAFSWEGRDRGDKRGDSKGSGLSQPTRSLQSPAVSQMNGLSEASPQALPQPGAQPGATKNSQYVLSRGTGLPQPHTLHSGLALWSGEKVNRPHAASCALTPGHTHCTRARTTLVQTHKCSHVIHMHTLPHHAQCVFHGMLHQHAREPAVVHIA